MISEKKLLLWIKQNCQELLDRALDITEKYTIEQLELLFTELNSCIISYQNKWDKSDLRNVSLHLCNLLLVKYNTKKH